MNEILEKISNVGIVPVVVIEDADNAVRTVEALSNGGIDVAEVTFRTDAAEESIKRISEARPDIILGAGTVTSVEQVDRAVRAGAPASKNGILLRAGFYCASSNSSGCSAIHWAKATACSCPREETGRTAYESWGAPVSKAYGTSGRAVSPYCLTSAPQNTPASTVPSAIAAAISLLLSKR